MNKVSYMGNGETTEFTFNFPYFETSDITVLKNNQPATGFTVIGISGGVGADMPYIGGKIIFETAPTTTDSITIVRKLSLERPIDYQPTGQIDSTTLNHDMNYAIEVLKDFQNDLESIKTLNGDPTATQEMLLKLDTVSQQISAMGDITQVRNNISTLDTRTNGIIDYVVETQAPTAENNYTWYRKYKSGWVEQGGSTIINAQKANTQLYTDVNLPITMANQAYLVNIAFITDGGSTTGLRNNANGRGTTKLTIGTYSTTEISQSYRVTWEVKGSAA